MFSGTDYTVNVSLLAAWKSANCYLRLPLSTEGAVCFDRTLVFFAGCCFGQQSLIGNRPAIGSAKLSVRHLPPRTLCAT